MPRQQTGPSRGPRPGFGLSLLLLLVLLLPTAHAGFPWPGGSSSQKGDSPAETQAAHAARFEAVTGGGLKERTLPKGVCLREMHATALSSYAYPANNPIEDRHVLLDEQQGVVGVGVGGGNPQGGEGEEKVPGMLHAAVFDGHGGFEVAEMAHQSLVARVKETLLGLPRHLLFDDRIVTNALARAFVLVEQEWITHVESLPDTQSRVKKSTIGACGLYALLLRSTLFVANAGDCRAVLGRRKPPSEEEDLAEEGIKEAYEALPLSFDHNSREAREQERLLEEHPGEEADIVKCFHDGQACYVKGRLQPVRAFGDLHLKLDEFAPPPSSGIAKWTPPYVSAIPEITSTRLNRLDDFVVLASDGLWENFNNGEVVALVAEMRQKGRSAEEAAEALTEAALARVAEGLRASVEQIKAIPPGRERRGRHDDITVLVLFFEETRRGDCPLPGTPEYEAEVEEDEDDLRLVDEYGGEEEEEEDEEDYMEGDYGGEGWADDDDDGAWIEAEDWDEDGEDEWEEDVDLHFMDEL